MKATSIEQIREHLARGGRVVSGDNEIMEVTQKWIIGFAVSYHISDKPLDYHDFELLPLEEKEPVRQYYYHVDACRAGDVSSGACICWHDEGTGPLKDNPERVRRWREKPVDHGTLPGLLGKALGNRISDAFKDHGTQKGQEDKFPREFAKDWYPFEPPQPSNDSERMQRIRTRLLHGQWPEMTDLLSWWEATTGERIEHGKRCNACECTGQVRQYVGNGQYDTVNCSQCVHGYSVRPTWMEDEKQ